MLNITKEKRFHLIYQILEFQKECLVSVMENVLQLMQCRYVLLLPMVLATYCMLAINHLATLRTPDQLVLIRLRNVMLR